MMFDDGPEQPCDIPLLELPRDAVKCVLRVMTAVQLFKLSLLSKRTKSLVRSRQLSARELNVSIGDNIGIVTQFMPFQSFPQIYFFMEHPGNNAPKMILRPLYIYFDEPIPGAQPRRMYWTNEEYEVKDWLEHLFTVFHRQQTGIGFSRDAYQFDFNSVYESFKGPTDLSIEHTGSYEYNKQVLEKLSPKEVLWIGSDVFEDKRIPRKILIQNFDFLAVLSKISLDDLLCVNSRELKSCSESSSSLNDINRFLKLWKLGSNPNLEHLNLKLDETEVITEAALMEGIPYQKVPVGPIRYFKSRNRPDKLWIGSRMDLYVMDIHRVDGMKASATVQNLPGMDPTFNFYVWYDHCLAGETDL